MAGILVIEAGGPTAAAIGGTDRPTWLPPERSDVTVFDVPGEYSAVAFQPRGVPYQLTETSFAYQGIGIGGNSMFNGMLFQTNPPAIFDARWPAGWKWRDGSRPRRSQARSSLHFSRQKRRARVPSA